MQLKLNSISRPPWRGQIQFSLSKQWLLNITNKSTVLNSHNIHIILFTILTDNLAGVVTKATRLIQWCTQINHWLTYPVLIIYNSCETSVITMMTKPVPWCHRGCTAVHEALPSQSHHHHRHRCLVSSPVGRVLARDVWHAASDYAVCPVAEVSPSAGRRCSSAAAETASSPAYPSTPAKLFTPQPVLHVSKITTYLESLFTI